MKKSVLSALKNLAVSLLLLAAATGLGFVFFHFHFHETNIVVGYLLAILLISRFTSGYVYGLAASVAALLMYNWFFTDPYFTLKVKDPTYIITFAIMTLTAVITSALTTKVKEVAAKDKEKQMEMSALYQLTNHLTDARDEESVASVAVNAVSRLLTADAAFLCFGEDKLPECTFIQQRSDGTQTRRRLENREEFGHRIEGLREPVIMGPEFYDYPIYGRTAVLAVVRVPAAAAEALTDTHLRLLHSVMESTSLALERLRSLHNQAKARELAAQERYRSNLLRSISHDIRTPLAGILGNSEMLMDMTDRDDLRYSFAEAIHDDAGWLHSLVENILSLTKLQDGRVSLKKVPEAVEEVIGAALGVMEKRLPGRRFAVDIPDSLLMVPMDARLITQVLVNLLDNAAKHSPADSVITLAARPQPDNGPVSFSVSDEGTGIAEEVMPHLFQMFFTTHGEGTGAKRGVGLGLSICQTIVEAHGGTITAANRTDGPGAVFTFTLPLEGETP